MRYLLNIAYLAALFLGLPWLLYSAIRKQKYRAGWSEKFWGRLPATSGELPVVWCHAVSVGEVNVLVTMLPAMRGRWPACEYRVTTTTRTGFELACSRFPNCQVSYAPLDFSWAVSTALRRLRPRVLILVELELWPNLVTLAARSGTNVAIVNGRLSESSYRGYDRLRFFVTRVLSQMRLIAVQDESYEKRFRQLGADEQLAVTGSVKFDGAQSDRDNSETVRLGDLIGIQQQHRVFLAGSTQEPEEELSLAAFRELHAEYRDLRLIIVPRHPERFDQVANLLDRSGLRWQRRSCLEDHPPGQREAYGFSGEYEVLLVDTVGELSHWWGVAHIGLVGGSMGTRGGQNMIEPAAYGVAVSFGPNTKNFRDVTELLLERQAAVVVRNEIELASFVRRCLAETGYCESLGLRAQSTVQSQRGAMESTLELLQPLMPGNQAASSRPRQMMTNDRAANENSLDLPKR